MTLPSVPLRAEHRPAGPRRVVGAAAGLPAGRVVEIEDLLDEVEVLVAVGHEDRPVNHVVAQVFADLALAAAADRAGLVAEQALPRRCRPAASSPRRGASPGGPCSPRGSCRSCRPPEGWPSRGRRGSTRAEAAGRWPSRRRECTRGRGAGDRRRSRLASGPAGRGRPRRRRRASGRRGCSSWHRSRCRGCSWRRPGRRRRAPPPGRPERLAANEIWDLTSFLQ